MKKHLLTFGLLALAASCGSSDTTKEDLYAAFCKADSATDKDATSSAAPATFTSCYGTFWKATADETACKKAVDVVAKTGDDALDAAALKVELDKADFSTEEKAVTSCKAMGIDKHDA